MVQTQFDEKTVESMLRTNLRQVPIYHDKHSVFVTKLRGSVCIGYRTARNTMPIGTTHFDLQTIDGICYILYIELAQNERGKGYGRMLYDAIGNFARDCRCAKVRLTPSGTTVGGKSRLEYMLSIGYSRCGDVEVEKIL